MSAGESDFEMRYGGRMRDLYECGIQRADCATVNPCGAKSFLDIDPPRIVMDVGTVDHDPWRHV